MIAASFYDSVMRELVFALGAALLLRTRSRSTGASRTRMPAVQRTVAKSRAGSPVRGYRRSDASVDLPQAPLARTVTYLIIGFVVMVAGLAAMINLH